MFFQVRKEYFNYVQVMINGIPDAQAHRLDSELTFMRAQKCWAYTHVML